MTIYVASPYSHASEGVRFQRFLAVREFVWLQMQMGKVVISPIVYGHQFARDFGAPQDAEFWSNFNHELFLRCDSMAVLMLDGWQDSLGVQMEMRWAEREGYVIEYHEPMFKGPRA